MPSELPGLQVERIGLRIGRAHLRCRAEQLHPQFLHYLARDLVLDLENIVHLAIVGLGPEMEASGGADQLSGDPELVPALAHRSLEHVRTCNRRAISGISTSLPLKENDEVRAETLRSG